jgi:hypothetical protein
MRTQNRGQVRVSPLRSSEIHVGFGKTGGLRRFQSLGRNQRRSILKKLLVALGLSSALIFTPALAQTSDQPAAAPGAAAPAAGDTAMKPMKPKTHKARSHKHKSHKKAKMAPAPKSDAPADPNAPKT